MIQKHDGAHVEDERGQPRKHDGQGDRDESLRAEAPPDHMLYGPPQAPQARCTWRPRPSPAMRLRCARYTRAAAPPRGEGTAPFEAAGHESHLPIGHKSLSYPFREPARKECRPIPVSYKCPVLCTKKISDREDDDRAPTGPVVACEARGRAREWVGDRPVEVVREGKVEGDRSYQTRLRS